MSAPSFTPGPWIHDKSPFGDWGWIRSRGEMVAVCSIPKGADLNTHRRDGTDPTEANANLIAAAPELLEALKAMLAANGGVAVMPTLEAREHNAATQFARAVIKKAEGGES